MQKRAEVEGICEKAHVNMQFPETISSRAPPDTKSLRKKLLENYCLQFLMDFASSISPGKRDFCNELHEIFVIVAK